MVGLWLNVDSGSLLWAEFTSSIKHYMKTTQVSSARFQSLILHEVHSHTSVLLHEDNKVATFSQLHIPKLEVDDLIMFPTVGHIPDSMLNLVSSTNKLYI